MNKNSKYFKSFEIPRKNSKNKIGKFYFIILLNLVKFRSPSSNEIA